MRCPDRLHRQLTRSLWAAALRPWLVLRRSPTGRSQTEALSQRVFVEARQAIDVLAQLIEGGLAAVDQDEVLVQGPHQLLTKLGAL